MLYIINMAVITDQTLAQMTSRFLNQPSRTEGNKLETSAIAGAKAPAKRPREAERRIPHPWGLEWPSLLVAALIYTGFLVLTWHYRDLPWWLLLPLGAYLVAWHGSLQHEVVHGHPTSKPWLNELIVLPSLWLWIPFRIYRQSHLQHHDNSRLTDPLYDPESFYLSAADWSASPWWKRKLLTAQNSGLGRLLLGPAVTVSRLYWQEGRRFLRGDFRHLGAWLLHLLAVAPVLVWVVVVCEIPLHAYLLLFVYPGISLTLLRSFIEHQAAEAEGERTVIVEAGPVFSLLFLNNNLHAVHHAAPGLPWYRLPEVWRHRRAQILAGNGGYHYRGYLQVLWRHLLRAKEPVLHPIPTRS